MRVTEHTKVTLYDEITLKFSSLSLTGALIYQVVKIRDRDAQAHLNTTYTPVLTLEGLDDEGMPFVEQLTLRQESIGGAAATVPPGQDGSPVVVAIKDYSEHTGLADSLVEAGVGEIVFTLYVGPFNSPVQQLQIKMAGAT